MPNPFVKAWKYSMAWFGAKVDEKADPKIQIQQAIEEAQRQHQALSQQAAQVIGNQRQLEMKLSRQMDDVQKLRASARQALIMADKARADGEETKAVEYEQAAQSFAGQLVSGEKNLEDLKVLHDQALQAAQQAKEAVERNSVVLREKLTERTQLLSQLEQAKMQETVSASLQQMSEMAAPGDVPTLGEVRDKIERRYATALGQAELANSTMEGRMIEVQKSAIDMASASRLDEIRASLRQEQLAPAEKPAVESGESAGEKPTA